MSAQAEQLGPAGRIPNEIVAWVPNWAQVVFGQQVAGVRSPVGCKAEAGKRSMSVEIVIQYCTA